MRTLVHVSLILIIGAAMGFAIRGILKHSKSNNANLSGANGPGPDDTVFTNDPNQSDEPVEAPDPIQPPEDEEWLSRFELLERSGKTVTSEELLGKPYVVSFFFSRCPSICVKQNQKLKELQDAFEGQGVRFIAISVDPAYDSPQVLKEYAARFGADKDQWLFMTGDLTYVRRVGAEIFRQPVNEQLHTERFILVDPKGEIEGVYSWPEKIQFEKLQTKIREYLNA